jgi:hypothetical protein
MRNAIGAVLCSLRGLAKRLARCGVASVAGA